MRPNSFITSALAVIAISLGACMTGKSVEDYGPASLPQGMGVTVRVEDERLEGELLEVRDSSIAVLTSQEVVVVRFAAIRRLALSGERGGYAGGLPSPRLREHLRLVSRFPQGLAPEHLARLLEVRNQAAVRTIRERARK